MTITGIISRLMTNKGYGYIARDGADREYFFHRSTVVGAPFESLREGQRVSFEEEASPKGPRAYRVTAT